MNGVNAEALVPFECGKCEAGDSAARSGPITYIRDNSVLGYLRNSGVMDNRHRVTATRK